VTDSSNPKSEIPDSKSSIPVTVPELGTADEPVRVSAWFVEVGDLVETGEPILEVMVAGITCDVCSPASGRISRTLKDLDSVVLPGEVVAWLDPRSSRVSP
jgi:pyruvate/2-oxoglutarate dehydrogenase complex dihydrolipoamide acyltransferase (E2) component